MAWTGRVLRLRLRCCWGVAPGAEEWSLDGVGRGIVCVCGRQEGGVVMLARGVLRATGPHPLPTPAALPSAPRMHA